MIELSDIKMRLTKGDIQQVKFCLEYHSDFDGVFYKCKLIVQKRKKHLYEKMFKEIGLEYKHIRDYVVDSEYYVRWRAKDV